LSATIQNAEIVHSMMLRKPTRPSTLQVVSNSWLAS